MHHVFKGVFLRMSLLPGKSRAVSEEHGEQFHQEISTMEERYQGKWSPSMQLIIISCILSLLSVRQ